MAVILIDSCVISDLGNESDPWFEWSASTLESLDDENSFVINPIVYAEVSVAYPSIEQYQEYINKLDFDMVELPKESLFLAGKAFVQYKKRKGNKLNVLPDFFIGAHAAVMGYKLMTRDKGRFSTYFPKIDLIIPNN